MNICFIFLIIFLIISQYQCEISSCKTNCDTDEECWREALTYHSSKLIKELFSFANLSVHVNTYQQRHSNEINDSILFINNALENHLLNELIDTNLTMNLFLETKKILINSCQNLTLTPINEVNELPSLTCSLSTCSSDKLNIMILLIISILITILILLICILQIFQTHRHTYSSIKIQQHTSF